MALINKRPIRDSLSIHTLVNVIGIPYKFAGMTISDFKTAPNFTLHSSVGRGADVLSLQDSTNNVNNPEGLLTNKELNSIKSFVSEYINDMYNVFCNAQGIYFFGSNGTGKTMLSSIILKEAYRRRFSCHRITFQEYVQLCTALWGKRGEDRESGEEYIATNIKGVEFLVIEEIGKEPDTKLDTRAILEDLLRYREDKGYPTIFAANISLERVKEMYGDSVYSLIEGNCVKIKMSTDDKRKVWRKRH